MSGVEIELTWLQSSSRTHVWKRISKFGEEVYLKARRGAERGAFDKPDEPRLACRLGTTGGCRVGIERSVR